MPDGRSGLEIVRGVTLPPSAWRFHYARSSGPGGQNVNKVNTKVALQVNLAALMAALGPEASERLRQIGGRCLSHRHFRVTSDEHRSQEANRRACLSRMREMLLQARTRPRVRHATQPSRASIERRLQSKLRRGRIKSLRRTDEDGQ